MSRMYKGYEVPTKTTQPNWADISEEKDIKMIDAIEAAQTTASSAQTAVTGILATYNSEKQNYVTKSNLKQGANVSITNTQNGDISIAATDTKPNNSTITIQKNGVNVDNFTTNAASNKMINIPILKTDVGLGNVDNTSDMNKPISTAVQTALNDKASNMAVTVAVKAEENRAIVEEQRIEELTVNNKIAVKAEKERAINREDAIDEALRRTHANTGALEFVGVVYSKSDTLPEEVRIKLKVGTFWLKRDGDSGMPDFDTADSEYLKDDGDLLWYNGSDFEQYREDYQEKIFHLWSNLDDGQGYYRFGYKWNILNVDLDLYATKVYVGNHLENYYTQSETDEQIHDAVTPRLLPENIFAGENIELTQTGKNVTISATNTIPNDNTITIQKNGVNVDNFTTNAASNKMINIPILKTDVGLGNVDNTSDMNKPISTAVQTALNDKASILSAFVCFYAEGVSSADKYVRFNIGVAAAQLHETITFKALLSIAHWDIQVARLIELSGTFRGDLSNAAKSLLNAGLLPVKMYRVSSTAYIVEVELPFSPSENYIASCEIRQPRKLYANNAQRITSVSVTTSSSAVSSYQNVATL